MHNFQVCMYEDKLAYDILIKKYKCDTRDHRRSLLELMVLYNICQGTYDCSCLLSQIHIRVPTFVTRGCPLFYVNNTRTNAGVRAPLRRMCDVYNKEMLSLDIFASSRIKFKSGVKNIFHELYARAGKLIITDLIKLNYYCLKCNLCLLLRPCFIYLLITKFILCHSKTYLYYIWFFILI